MKIDPMFFWVEDFCQHELKERVETKVGNQYWTCLILLEEIFETRPWQSNEILKPKLDDESQRLFVFT
jgi:hypothetical protein